MTSVSYYWFHTIARLLGLRMSKKVSWYKSHQLNELNHTLTVCVTSAFVVLELPPPVRVARFGLPLRWRALTFESCWVFNCVQNLGRFNLVYTKSKKKSTCFSSTNPRCFFQMRLRSYSNIPISLGCLGDRGRCIPVFHGCFPDVHGQRYPPV